MFFPSLPRASRMAMAGLLPQVEVLEKAGNQSWGLQGDKKKRECQALLLTTLR